MNIMDFLIDNYIWIIAIILITIVTIIGFLADKKKSGNKKEKNQQPVQNTNNQPVNGQIMQYQGPVQMMSNSMENNMITPQNNINNMAPNPINIQQQMATQPQPVQPIPNPIDVMNNPQPIENISQPTIVEPMHQPILEQPTNMVPQMDQNLNNMQNYTIPTPTAEITPTQPVMPQPMMQEQPVQPMPNYNIPTSTPNNDSNTSTPGFMPNFGPMPQPTNLMQQQPVVPQPVMPQSIMQQPMPQEQPVQPIPNYNNPSQMPINIQNSIPQQNVPFEQPIQNAQSTAQPVNFVYGQPNNPQNM